jgi:voltage-gated potassium channel
MEPSTFTSPPEEEQLRHVRYALLHRFNAWLELPLLWLSFGWLALLGFELLYGLTPGLKLLSEAIWVVFGLDFLLRFLVAPKKRTFLKANVIDLVSLLVPALRLFRLGRVFQAVRVARGLRLVKVLGSLNRGMRALGTSFGRRGLGYVAALTAVVVLLGSAGMYAFEKDIPGGLYSYPEALYWTAMLFATMGSDYWPKTVEGRALCLLMALYGFGMFGYFTAMLAAFFMGQDAENPESETASAEAIAALHAEIRQLRADLQSGALMKPPAS